MTSREWAYEHFSEFVRRLLITRSAAQVANGLGIDKTTVLRAASGMRDTKLSTVRAIVGKYVR